MNGCKERKNSVDNYIKKMKGRKKKKNLCSFGLIFERGIVNRHEDKDTLTSKRPGLHLISGHCIVLITKPLCYGAPTVYI